MVLRHYEGTKEEIQVVSRNFEKYVKNANAEFNIGTLYLKSLGVQFDYNEAMRWYKKVLKNKYTDSNTMALLSWEFYIMSEYDHSKRANNKAIFFIFLFLLNIWFINDTIF